MKCGCSSRRRFATCRRAGCCRSRTRRFTGNALADLLLGLPTVTVGATLDNPQNLRAPSYAVFVQDSFEVSPTLTVSAGVRYELNMPPVDANDRVTLYDPETGTIVPVGHGRHAARADTRPIGTTSRRGSASPGRAGIDRRARRLRHLVRSGRARAERVPLLQRAVLRSQHLLHGAAVVHPDALRSVPGRLSAAAAEVGDGRRSAICTPDTSISGT